MSYHYFKFFFFYSILVFYASNLFGSRLVGYFDGANVENGIINGWAIELDTPRKPVEVQIWLGDESGKTSAKKIIQLKSDKFRKDLKTVANSTGNHSFEFQIPDEFRNGKHYFVYIMALAPSDPKIMQQLSNSPKRVAFNAKLKSSN